MSSKLGRKGDPRMHRAVAARMANPNLSLYEALCIGGFDYSENDDKSVLDSKQVTLGQRKNQLSRRLRLARKSNSGGGKNPPRSPSAVGNNGGATSTSTTENRNITNIVSSKEPQPRENNAFSKAKDHHSTIYRQKVDFKNELATGSFNGNNKSIGIGDAVGDHQAKRTRFTCPPAPVTQPKLNWNHSLHQGWMYVTDPYMNSQVTTSQSVSQYQPGASAVALSSLTSTAQAVGLTLEQLALTLSSNTTSLTKLVAEARSGESETKQELMALNLYQNDIKPLYTKCLLVAGVDASLAEQNTPTYVKFATKAWEFEGERLQTLRNAMNIGKETKHTVAFAESSFQQNYTKSSSRTPTTTNSKANKDNSNNDNNTITSSDWNSTNRIECNQDNCQADKEHNQHSHEHEHSHTTTKNANNDSDRHDSSECESRHFHRVGECGHKAVIHKPKDGPPHIDFIVNDQIECYQGQDSMSLAGTSLAGRSEKSLDSYWPSKLKCKEVDEAGPKSCAKSVGAQFDSNWGHLEPLVQEPKTFKLSEISAQDPEWTFDATDGAGIDNVAMGLFELGREVSSDVANC